MPYINKNRRDAILTGTTPRDVGELNFAITTLVKNFMQSRGNLRYTYINEVIGVLESAKLELYRRVAAPCEGEKIKESGDVY